MPKISKNMFLDTTKRPIGNSMEFAVAVDNTICHGLSMDPANYELKPEKDEEILVIETFNSFAEGEAATLSELVFRCKKGVETILPNVLILDGNRTK